MSRHQQQTHRVHTVTASTTANTTAVISRTQSRSSQPINHHPPRKSAKRLRGLHTATTAHQKVAALGQIPRCTRAHVTCTCEGYVDISRWTIASTPLATSTCSCCCCSRCCWSSSWHWVAPPCAVPALFALWSVVAHKGDLCPARTQRVGMKHAQTETHRHKHRYVYMSDSANAVWLPRHGTAALAGSMERQALMASPCSCPIAGRGCGGNPSGGGVPTTLPPPPLPLLLLLQRPPPPPHVLGLELGLLPLVLLHAPPGGGGAAAGCCPRE